MRCRSSSLAVVLVITACAQKAPLIPGTTDIAVSAVTIEARDTPLVLDYSGLYGKLGVVAKGTFNEFRLAEDGRRIAAFMQNAGYFDAEVGAPVVTETKSIAITWRVHEGVRYRISATEIVGAPSEQRAALEAMIPFRAGDAVDVATYRGIRTKLADRLRAVGYSRALGYSRTFVDRDAKTVAWTYFIEPGPLTRIGAITVEGNKRVSAAAILVQSGLEPGVVWSTEEKRRAELALLDSGSFASASVVSDTDPGLPPMPDHGGLFEPEQVDADGAFTPRTFPPEVALRVSVVEAPARQLAAEIGVEADPSRIDAYAGARVLFRDLFAPLHHLVVEANVGYGWFLDDSEIGHGVYGNALVQYQHPGFLTPKLELRLSHAGATRCIQRRCCGS